MFSVINTYDIYHLYQDIKQYLPRRTSFYRMQCIKDYQSHSMSLLFSICWLLEYIRMQSSIIFLTFSQIIFLINSSIELLIYGRCKFEIENFTSTYPAFAYGFAVYFWGQQYLQWLYGCYCYQFMSIDTFPISHCNGNCFYSCFQTTKIESLNSYGFGRISIIVKIPII